MDQNNSNGSWFHRAVSLDEMKTSSIVIAFLIFCGFAVYSLITKGDIPSNLLSLLELMIGVIGGVNAVSFVGNNLMMNKNTQQMPMQNNMYGSNMNGYNNYGMNNGMVNNYSPTQLPLQTAPILQQTQVQQTTTTTVGTRAQDRPI